VKLLIEDSILLLKNHYIYYFWLGIIVDFLFRPFEKKNTFSWPLMRNFIKSPKDTCSSFISCISIMVCICLHIWLLAPISYHTMLLSKLIPLLVIIPFIFCLIFFNYICVFFHLLLNVAILCLVFIFAIATFDIWTIWTTTTSMIVASSMSVLLIRLFSLFIVVSTIVTSVVIITPRPSCPSSSSSIVLHIHHIILLNGHLCL